MQFTAERDRNLGDRGRDMQQRSQTGLKSEMLLLYMPGTLGRDLLSGEGDLCPSPPPCTALPRAALMQNVCECYCCVILFVILGSSK